MYIRVIKYRSINTIYILNYIIIEEMQLFAIILLIGYLLIPIESEEIDRKISSKEDLINFSDGILISFNITIEERTAIMASKSDGLPDILPFIQELESHLSTRTMSKYSHMKQGLADAFRALRTILIYLESAIPSEHTKLHKLIDDMRVQGDNITVIYGDCILHTYFCLRYSFYIDQAVDIGFIININNYLLTGIKLGELVQEVTKLEFKNKMQWKDKSIMKGLLGTIPMQETTRDRIWYCLGNQTDIATPLVEAMWDLHVFNTSVLNMKQGAEKLHTAVNLTFTILQLFIDLDIDLQLILPKFYTITTHIWQVHLINAIFFNHSMYIKIVDLMKSVLATTDYSDWGTNLATFTLELLSISNLDSLPQYI